MAVQDRLFNLEEMFLAGLRSMPNTPFFNDDDEIQVVVIGNHLIIRIHNETFTFPIVNAEAFGVPEITNETFTGFAMGETFMNSQ